MLFDQVTREHIVEAISIFKEKGFPKGFSTSTSYDLVHEGELYPPKAIMAYASQLATGDNPINDFRGGPNHPAFNTLEKNGFEIQPKNQSASMLKPSISEILSDFIEQAQTNDLKTKHYPKAYGDFKLRVSFGQGAAAKIPWISILKEPNTTSKGIYPVYLYYKDLNRLILAYGISETNKPEQHWKISQVTNINDYMNEKYDEAPSRYGSSFVFRDYKADNLPIAAEIEKDLERILEVYLKSLEEQGTIEGELAKFNSEHLEFYLNHLQQILLKFGIKQNDPRVVYTLRNGRINFTVGQRYSWILYKNEPQAPFGIISDNKINQSSEAFTGTSFINYYSKISRENLDSRLIDSHFKAITLELARTGKSSFRAKNNDELEAYIFHRMKPISGQKAVNKILYGPPGTGKTYNLSKEACLLIDGEIKSEEENRARFDELLDNNQIVFTTFHQAFSYEDFIEGIKPVMDQEEGGELAYRIEEGVFKKICTRAANDPQNRYAIFIDEINRGNIANIFGELITLIETDKRAGMPNAMSVTLPYSKQPFSVPANLDIIGTMNTADRSVEALDTALRRRFNFVEMLPQPHLLSDILGDQASYKGISLVEILETINLRIEKLIDRDHSIGHAYFLKLKDQTDLKEGLIAIFCDNIIPLLQEYFYNDYPKIGLVLGSGFIKAMEQEVTFAEFEAEGSDDYLERPLYRLATKEELSQGDNLEIALNTLLGKRGD